MNRRSALIIAAGLVLALLSGTVSRVATLRAGAPVTIVVQTAASQAPTATTQAMEAEGDSA